MAKQTGIERVREVGVRAEAELGRYVDEARASREIIAKLRQDLANRPKVNEVDFLRYQKEARASRQTIRDLQQKVGNERDFLRYQKEARASRGTIRVLEARVEELEAELEEAQDGKACCGDCEEFSPAETAALHELWRASFRTLEAVKARGSLLSTSSKVTRLTNAEKAVAKFSGKLK